MSELHFSYATVTGHNTWPQISKAIRDEAMPTGRIDAEQGRPITGLDRL